MSASANFGAGAADAPRAARHPDDLSPPTSLTSNTHSDYR